MRTPVMTLTFTEGNVISTEKLFGGAVVPGGMRTDQ
jgi:hypothetical protein